MATGNTFLGVDIGGTKVAAGLVNASGKILLRTQVAMAASGSAAEGLEAVTSAIDRALAAAKEAGEKPPAAIGLSSPGPLDPRRGIVVNPPNLACWRNFPLASEVEKHYRLPTHLDNDANAAALAEARWGAGKGMAAVFYATLGTGVGAGLVLDGKVYHGRTGAAVEGGHLTSNFRGLRCGCGKRGCIEALASGPAVAARARRMAARNLAAAQRLLRLAGGRSRSLTAEMVGQAWHAGDRFAGQVLNAVALDLAIWLGNIIDLLEPDVIIFGGGMGALMAEWFPQIKKQVSAWSINSRAAEIPLLAARYGADSGIAGGAALCLPS
ncbi:MAG TPA: ROK family protein [Terriglobales bacterium]|nr:ROK family protein [Terriglobales bacterium]